jgi:hypothetical protein
MLFNDLLLSQYVTSLDECTLLNEVESTGLPSISAIQFVVKGRVKEDSLTKVTTLVGGLYLSKLFQLEKILRFVISFDHLSLLINLEFTRLLK